MCVISILNVTRMLTSIEAIRRCLISDHTGYCNDVVPGHWCHPLFLVTACMNCPMDFKCNPLQMAARGCYADHFGLIYFFIICSVCTVEGFMTVNTGARAAQHMPEHSGEKLACSDSLFGWRAHFLKALYGAAACCINYVMDNTFFITLLGSETQTF